MPSFSPLRKTGLLTVFSFTVASAAACQSAPTGPTCSLSVNPNRGAPPLMITATGTCSQGSNGLATLKLDYGDGTTPQIQTEDGRRQDTITGTHTYTNSGNYVVTVTANDLAGLQGSASQTVVVNAPPTCTFSVDKTTGPAPLTVNGSARCTDPENDITNASIIWGDGGSTSFSCTNGVCQPLNATHSYARPGTYRAYAQAADGARNQSQSQAQTITAQSPPPTCTLVLDKTSGTAPLTVDASGSNCTAGQGGSMTSYTITWGDGSSSNVSCDGSCPPFSGTHGYNNAGTYTVALTGTDFTGGTGSDTKTVTVTQLDSTPKCSLSSSSNQGVAPLTVQFSGACTDAGKDISSANSRAMLNFGDNSPAQSISTANGGNFSNVSHVYQTPGTYTATYTVTDDSGHTGTANTVITVSQNQPPTCTLTLDKNSGTAPLTVNANARCTDPDDGITSASINWGDGSPAQPLGCDGPCGFAGSHTFTTPGTYSVVVSATDAGGQTGSANQSVTVTAPVDSTPRCSLNSDSQSGAAPFTVTFNGSCQDAGNDLGQGSTSTLNFGDGTNPRQVSPASFANVSHVYQSPGTYTATFTATDSTQHTGTASLTITVTTPVNSTPLCTLTSDKQTGAAPLTVNFTGNCSDAGNDLIPSSEKIDFGDGTPSQSGTSASHTYTQAGSYKVTLSAADSHGNTGSTTETVAITASQPPVCTLSVVPTSGTVPLAVSATGSCTQGSSPIASTTLDFGDGTVQNGTSGTHTYTNPGSYTVVVTAIDQNGSQGKGSQVVVASAPTLPPSCTLSVLPTSGTVPLMVTAIGSCTAGSNPIANTTIEFGDGTTRNGTSGTHSYLKAGTFTAKLTAIDSAGLSGSASQVVTVNASSFPQGVFVGVSEGKVMRFDTTGKVLQTLDSTVGGTISDMAFDNAGTLYSVDFTAGNISRFNLASGTLLGQFGGGYSCQPESMVFDGAGNVYVGQQGCTKNILKLDPSGKVLAMFQVATEEQGSDDVALSDDQCTLLYTSEGPSIFRYDVCRNQQLAPFATGLNKTLTLKVLPDGGVLVANLINVVRLDSNGQTVRTYALSGQSCLYGVALDPDGASFWVDDYCSSNVFHVNLASGSVISQFNTGTPSGTVFGLAIAGTGLNVAGLGNAGSMAASPQSATLAIGQSATFTISFTPNATAAGKTLSLACADLPPGLSCAFTPPAITLGAAGSSSSATLTITRTTVAELRRSGVFWLGSAFTGSIPVIVLIGLRPRRRRRSAMFSTTLILAATVIWGSCGGGEVSRVTTPQPTPPGTYTVIVLGTASGGQASTMVSLTLH